MTQVIDELVINLGLDPTKFTQGQRDALESFKKTSEGSVALGNQIEAQSKKTIEFFTTLKREALGILAVFLGGRGIKEFVGYITHLDATTSRLGRTFNMTERELSTWQGVFEQIGGTAESAAGAIQGITNAVHGGLITGEIPLFARYIGGLFDPVTHKVKNAGQVIKELSEFVKKSGMDGATAAAFLSAAVPGMNQDLINLILEGPAAIDKYTAAAERAGGVTKKSAEEAKKYQQELALLDRSATSLGRNIFTFMAPALIAITKSFADLFALLNRSRAEVDKAGNQSHQDLVDRFGDGLATSKTRMPNASDKGIYANDLSPEARGLLRAISPGESGGAYNVEYGGTTFDSYADHPNVAHRITSGPNAGKTSTAAGRYQMLYSTWLEAKNALGLKDFSPESQDKAAWWLAQRDYKKKTGRDLQTDLKSGDEKIFNGIGPALSGTWTSLPGGIEASRSASQFGSALGAPGAAVTAPTINNRKAGDNHTSSISIGAIHVASSKANPADVAMEIPRAIDRISRAASANQGLTG
jgi:muramidase (phage lysozyme)